MMQKGKYILLGILAILFCQGCKNSQNIPEQGSRQAIPVTVESIHKGTINKYIELTATSKFLYKSNIKSPITGYVDKISIEPGEYVTKNQILFTIRTKEAEALSADTMKSIPFSGRIEVKASSSGKVLSIEHPAGDYIAEGDNLCQIALPSSFVFLLDVPFELSSYVKENMPCQIIFPDSSVIQGITTSHLPVMNINSQTLQYYVKLLKQKDLPENIIAKVNIKVESINSASSLSKSCILSDETMSNFWVMKLINDTTAVKVKVKTGIIEGKYIQITSPLFSEKDLFLSSGNFGLGDTAYVKVNKSTEQ
jgi:hypothetical protein